MTMARCLIVLASASLVGAYVPHTLHGTREARRVRAPDPCCTKLRRFPLAGHARRCAIGPACAGVRSVAAPAVSTVSMKVFDWKRRTDTYSEESEFMLHNLRPAPGSAHRKIRKCRGMGSGKGGPGGYGMRGQLSRGGRPTRPGFEGGQTPLYRRIPKLRGKPTGPGHTKTIYGLIKVRSPAAKGLLVRPTACARSRHRATLRGPPPPARYVRRPISRPPRPRVVRSWTT